MKKRFLLVAMLSICILFSVAVNSANAALQWYNYCTIGAVGDQSGTVLIYASGGDQNLQANYYAVGQNTLEANHAMATALTAISTGAKVQVLVDVNDGRFYHLIISIMTFAP